MNIFTSRKDMLAQSSSWKEAGQSICLVPTMGNLHDGHLSLLEVAAANSDKVITSILLTRCNLPLARIFINIHERVRLI